MAVNNRPFFYWVIRFLHPILQHICHNYINVIFRQEEHSEQKIVYFPRLLNASPEQRNQYELSGGGTGIHWEEIDEDIGVPGLILGNKDCTYYKKRGETWIDTGQN